MGSMPFGFFGYCQFLSPVMVITGSHHCWREEHTSVSGHPPKSGDHLYYVWASRANVLFWPPLHAPTSEGAWDLRRTSSPLSKHCCIFRPVSSSSWPLELVQQVSSFDLALCRFLLCCFWCVLRQKRQVSYYGERPVKNS